jgi:hypothetical protein
MQSSPASHHVLPLRSKHSPQSPVLKHPLSMFFPTCERPSFTPVSEITETLKCASRTFIRTRRESAQQLLTPSNRVLLQKLTVVQLVNNSPRFTEPEGSLPCSYEPNIRPYPERVQSVHIFTPYFCNMYLNTILPPTPRSPTGLFPSGFSIRILYECLLPHM